jgi:histidine kinase
VVTIKGFESIETMVDAPLFSMMRVEDLLRHEKFIAKVYRNPNEHQIQSLKNMVQLVMEKNWSEALQPLNVVQQQDSIAVIFKDSAGCILRQYIHQQKKIKPTAFVRVALSICKMLSAFHAGGWIIGNLRPEHIFIDPDEAICKLSDFRKASRVFKKESDNFFAFASAGDLDYISPEQTGRINQVIDFRSDYYSIGVIFYEMLTGRPPFTSTSSSELLYAHIARQPAALNVIDPYLPQVLNDIVLKLLAKNPQNRYQSAAGLIHDLEQSIRFFNDENYRENFRLGEKDYVSRITISAKLMGRDPELVLMNDAYQLAGRGKKQALYIGGYSGVGKTRLVQEFQRTMVETTTFITKAKFDALQRNSPYTALIAAMRDLIRNLLREDEDKFIYWKRRLIDFLKGNGQIIIDVVPELEILVGKQSPVDELSPDESQNRFQQTFSNFIAAFSSDEHTLIVFLDDLQWADLASIKLIELIVLNNSIRKFFFIGAYRDQEVDPTHAFVISLARQQQRADIKEIKLLPLAKNTIASFILDTLQNKVERPDQLVDRVFQKTQGNIFFTIQLITSLNETGVLAKDESGIWQWSEKGLLDFNLGDNVVDLLIQKINNLNDLQKKIITTGACVGDSFDLLTVTNLIDEKLFKVADVLPEVINTGYLVAADDNLDHYIRSSHNISDTDINRIGNVRFQFAHDRIRQACLALVNDEEIAVINLRAGQFKLKNYTSAEIAEDIFIIASHFNKGRQFIQNKEDLDNLIEINLAAGRKASNATAYDSAINYLHLGRQSLNFRDHYRQLYEFYLLGAACKYQTGKYEESEKDLDELYAHCETRLDKLEVLILKVYMYTSNEQKEKAVEAGRLGFGLYGLYMPKSKPVVMLAVFKDIIKAKWLLRGKRIDALPGYAVMKDPEQIRFLEFTLAVSPPSYQYDQNLFAWGVMQMVNYSLKYGNNGAASFGYMGYGMILAQSFGDYQTGKKLADTGIQINKQLGYTVLKWKLAMCYNNFVQHWTQPVRPEFDNMQEIVNGCLSNGDPIYAGYGIFHYHQKKFVLGFPLPELQQSFENYLRVVDQRGDLETRHFLEGYYHAVRCLRGIDENVLLMGQLYNAPERLSQIVASSSFSCAADTYIAYINVLYQFGFFREALKNYLDSARFMPFIYHRYEYAEYNFYGGLICAMAFEKKLSPSRPYLKMLNGHLKKLKKWSEYCPDNFEPKYFLLQAELARITGDTGATATLYEKAIKSADKYLYINFKALANELAGRYHAGSGNVIIAKTYLDNARQAYLQWGAIGKVRHIEKEFGDLVGQSLLDKAKTGSSQGSLQYMDLDLVLEASQAVNSAKDINQVIEQLMQTVIQNSGADTGYILMRNRADLVIKASYNIHDGSRSVTEYPDADRLPLKTIRYVARVKEPFIINNPSRQTEYSVLPYFALHQPQSVLIFPILKQGELFGILYLENYSNEGVFDADRIGLLKLISAQIAMLLDNANLNTNMESLVKERTVTLETEKEQLSELLKNIFPREAIEELKATGKTTPQRLENVTVLMADIKGFSKISEKITPEELIGMIDNYFRAFDGIMGKYGLEKIKTIGDAYMAIGGIGNTLENGAEKMIMAALEMQQFAAMQLAGIEENDKVELRIGIHTGVVIAGVVGAKKLQYDIWGDTVNIAARMEQNSEPARVNISEATYQQVKGKFSFFYRGKIEAKNKGELDMYFAEKL